MYQEKLMEKQLLLLMQIMGSSYPTGAFSHSLGLETYICREEIKTVSDLRNYVVSTLKQNYLHFEGPSFCIAYQAGKDRDEEKMFCLDMENTAMRLTKENRQASLKMGQAFWRVTQEVFRDKVFSCYYQKIKKNHNLGNYSVAVGYWSGILEITLKESLLAFIFNSINNLVQVGTKTIPLGQLQVQSMLYSIYPQIIEVSEELIEQDTWEITNFLPAHDILSMQHESLYTKLYMS